MLMGALEFAFRACWCVKKRRRRTGVAASSKEGGREGGDDGGDKGLHTRDSPSPPSLPPSLPPLPRYCSFETITMTPIQLKMIEPSLMTPVDIAWLNGYHAQVCLPSFLPSFLPSLPPSLPPS